MSEAFEALGARLKAAGTALPTLAGFCSCVVSSASGWRLVDDNPLVFTEGKFFWET